ncbi:MAG: efflux RND transporter periplasmic adaptor subunit [Pseudomonadota bacterium]|nr:efflux RND transporter periplasmic adaptor subunit [Pseudomonadota bacterium]
MGILAVVVVAQTLTAGCREEPGTRGETSPEIHDIELFRIHKRILPIVYPVPGVVVPAERFQVASRISGFIEKVHVDEGESVALGAPLVEIDGATVQAMIRAAQAGVASARAERADAAEDVERYEGLARSQVLAEDQFRDSRVRLAQANAQVEKARAELDAQRQDERYTRITSPVHAMVRERLRDPGDLIMAGEPILRLDVLGAMEFEVFVPMTRVGAVVEGQPAKIELDSASEPVTGRVIGIVYSADPVTRRCKVRIALPDDHRLAPGRFGHARLVVGRENVAIVPQTAVVTRAGIEGVFLVDDEGNARFRSVRLGRRWDTDRELLAGVEAGSMIVLHPPEALPDGARFRQVGEDAP